MTTFDKILTAANVILFVVLIATLIRWAVQLGTTPRLVKTGGVANF